MIARHDDECYLENIAPEIFYHLLSNLDFVSRNHLFNTSRFFVKKREMMKHVLKNKFLEAGMNAKLFAKMQSLKNAQNQKIIYNWEKFYASFVSLPRERRESFTEKDDWQMLCLSGEFLAILHLKKTNHDPEKCDKYGTCAEHYIALSQSPLTLKLYLFLFKKPRLTLIEDKDKYNLLDYAALSGHLKTIELLKNEFKFSLKETMLHMVARFGTLKNFIKLIGLGLNPNSRDENGCTPFHVAVNNNDDALAFIRFGLTDEKLKNILKAKDRFNRSILYYAAQKGNIEIIKVCITVLKLSPFAYDYKESSPFLVSKGEEALEAMYQAINHKNNPDSGINYQI